MRNRVGIHSFVWGGGGSRSEIERSIEATSEMGYDFIEIGTGTPTSLNVKQYDQTLSRIGLGATLSTGLPPNCDISSSDPQCIERGEAFLRDGISVARDVGATDFVGILHSSFQKCEVAQTRNGIARSQVVIERVGEFAGDQGVKLSLEVVNRYENNLLNTAAQAVDYLDDLSCCDVGIHLDTFHMNIEEDDPEEAIQTAGQRLSYFHIGESHRGFLGTGTIDFASIFIALKAVGYEGPIAFETFSAANCGPELAGKLGVWRDLWSVDREIAAHGLKFIKSLLAN